MNTLNILLSVSLIASASAVPLKVAPRIDLPSFLPPFPQFQLPPPTEFQVPPLLQQLLSGEIAPNDPSLPPMPQVLQGNQHVLIMCKIMR